LYVQSATMFIKRIKKSKKLIDCRVAINIVGTELGNNLFHTCQEITTLFWYKFNVLNYQIQLQKML
jgi:hypothetical protein